MPLIQLDRLEVRLGSRTILGGLSGELDGRAVGLLGPNGAGKSTLINTLLGFLRPSAGAVRVLGRDTVRESAAIRQSTGYMPENDSFIGNMTAVRLVRYMAELAGLPPAAALERAHEALFLVGLGEERYRLVGTYSLGMKQLVKLAQAMAHGPRLLLLDEPTNGLDPVARQRMIGLLRRIRDQGEVRMIVSSHLLRDIDEICDEVLILANGRIAAIANIERERRSHRNFIELEATGTIEPFCAGVRGLGCECASFPGGRVKVVMPDHLEIADLYAIACRSGVEIRRMSRRRDSLEDIFLRAMELEREGRDHVRLQP